jgi:hypothetical protein
VAELGSAVAKERIVLLLEQIHCLLWEVGLRRFHGINGWKKLEKGGCRGDKKKG